MSKFVEKLTPLTPLDRGGLKPSLVEGSCLEGSCLEGSCLEGSCLEASCLEASPVKGRFGGVSLAPSPVKGRAGEGLAFDVVLTKRGILPYNKNLTSLARENRSNPTKAESKIWNEVLRMRQFAQYKFLRQKPIDNYIVDFYCSELCLVIEIDGDSHAETVEYDAVRTRVLETLRLTVIRYSNDDVLRNIEGVYDDLWEKVQKLSRLSLAPVL